ncbi:hypothetical protein Ancab_037539 [Ancistrocladus abbreviatus]
MEELRTLGLALTRNPTPLKSDFGTVEKNRYLYIRLFPEPSRVSKEQPPIARFIIRVSNSAVNRRSYTSPIHERLLRNSDDFVWPVDSTFYSRFIIDVEFLDLMIYPLNYCLLIYGYFLHKFWSAGSEAASIWPTDVSMQSLAAQSTLRSLSRMLYEGIHADVTINTADGSLRAHKAILSASSPVFQSMFLHNLREKESSTIEIEDMTGESCMTLLNYLYGTIKQEDFWKHRVALLAAANKYDITDLKDACEESLLEDINSGNVLERLQEAWLYHLNKLRKGCLMYLFDFGKIYDVKDEINDFFRHADRELMMEMFHETSIEIQESKSQNSSRSNAKVDPRRDMFFFVVGGLEQQVRQVLKRGVARCIICGSPADLVDYDKVLKLFFVPVWRWPGTEPVLYCDNCKLFFPESFTLPPPPPLSSTSLPDVLRCYSCTRAVDREFRFCPYCGASLAA